MPTEGGAEVRVRSDWLTELVVECRQDEIVLVKDMDPMASTPRNARIPIAGQADVGGLLVEFDSGRGKALDDALRVGVCRAIVDEGDLHLMLAHFLIEDRAERLFEEVRTVVGWDHHGPKRPGDVLLHRIEPDDVSQENPSPS
jgi:hypothetical protein